LVAAHASTKPDGDVVLNKIEDGETDLYNEKVSNNVLLHERTQYKDSALSGV